MFFQNKVLFFFHSGLDGNVSWKSIKSIANGSFTHFLHTLVCFDIKLALNQTSLETSVKKDSSRLQTSPVFGLGVLIVPLVVAVTL